MQSVLTARSIRASSWTGKATWICKIKSAFQDSNLIARANVEANPGQEGCFGGFSCEKESSVDKVDVGCQLLQNDNLGSRSRESTMGHQSRSPSFQLAGPERKAGVRRELSPGPLSMTMASGAYARVGMHRDAMKLAGFLAGANSTSCSGRIYESLQSRISGSVVVSIA
jgi:hypothetical protein